MNNHEKAISTLITNNFLGEAINCHNYVSVKNPKIKHYIFTIGQINSFNLNFIKRFKNIIHIPTEKLIDPKKMKELIKMYTPLEISCALRATCHKYILEKTSINRWLMIDADVAILGSLDDIFNKLNISQIFLTSHTKKPANEFNGIISNELSFLKHGLYNGGVVGFQRGEESKKAILWLEDRLLNYSENSRQRIVDNIQNRFDCLFLDQLWLNFIPIYFNKCQISFEHRFNLGHWNLWEKELYLDDKKIYIHGDKPVIAAHFSSLPLKNLSKVSLHSNLYIDKPNKIWGELSLDYLEKLKKTKSQLKEENYFYKKSAPRRSYKIKTFKFIKNCLSYISNFPP